MTRKTLTAESIHGQSGLDGCIFPETSQKAIENENFAQEIFNRIKEKSEEFKSKVNLVITGCMTNIAILFLGYP